MMSVLARGTPLQRGLGSSVLLEDGLPVLVWGQRSSLREASTCCPLFFSELTLPSFVVLLFL